MNQKTKKPSGQRLETELHILRELEANPAVNQRQLAQKLDVSLGSINYCLQALVSKGFVKVGNFRKSEQKGRYLYLLTPKGIAEKTRLTVDFLARKQAEYQRLHAEIKDLEGDLSDDG